MSYTKLVRQSWRSGDFTLRETPAPERGERPSDRELRDQARREIEEIVVRDAGDVGACRNAHKEDFMKLAPFVKFREEKFGAVLFETRSEKVFTLSPTGAAVVREIVAGTEPGRLAENLREKYQDASGRMAKEAEAFLIQLKEKGLVTD